MSTHINTNINTKTKGIRDNSGSERNVFLPDAEEKKMVSFSRCEMKGIFFLSCEAMALALLYYYFI